MTISERAVDHYITVSREMARRAAESADVIDAERRLPQDLAADMADEGLFRLLVPRSLGGAELDFIEYLRIVEIFGRADGSVAWCVNQNNVFATDSVRMPVETAQEIWADPRAVISNGPPMPPSCAVATDGGYRVTGRWNFSSGIRHANWVAALTPLGQQGEDGRQGVVGKRDVVLLIPKDQVEVLDVWQVNGLRGTGSFSFQANDLFVPAARAYGANDAAREGGPLYVIPKVLMFATGFGTVALGVARTALDAAIDIAGKKVPAKRSSILRDTSTTQRQIGEAEARWRSARAFLKQAASTLWYSACTDGALTAEDRIGLRLAATHANREAARVAAIAYDVSGSSGIFENNPIQRRFQDTQVITQQVQGRKTHYDTAGAFYLGLEPKSTYF